MTNVDFLLSLSLSELDALAEDAAERVARARLQHDRTKAQRWQCCISWAQLLQLDGITEMSAKAFNAARRNFLSL